MKIAMNADYVKGAACVLPENRRSQKRLKFFYYLLVINQKRFHEACLVRILLSVIARHDAIVVLIFLF